MLQQFNVIHQLLVVMLAGWMNFDGFLKDKG
jgi:hypothetical protein